MLRIRCRLALGLVGFVLPSSMAFPQAQSPSAPAEFEVASVRISAPCKGNCFFISPPNAPLFRVSNVSMDFLLAMAYGVNDYQIEGRSNWSESSAYDISARAVGDKALSYDQLKPLLQQLLVQRFKLVIHRQLKEISGYTLVVAQGGPKLESTTGGEGIGQIMWNEVKVQNTSMQAFASTLSHPLRCPVVDKTGIAGNYDIDLKYAPLDATDSTLPSIFTAVQEQLGLKLEPQKVPVEMLVVDHVEKVPTEN